MRNLDHNAPHDCENPSFDPGTLSTTALCSIYDEIGEASGNCVDFTTDCYEECS